MSNEKYYEVVFSGYCQFDPETDRWPEWEVGKRFRADPSKMHPGLLEKCKELPDTSDIETIDPKGKSKAEGDMVVDNKAKRTKDKDDA